MKLTHRCASILLLGVTLSLITGCAPQPPADTDPSPREKELRQTVAELREKLAATERELQQAKAVEQTTAQLTATRVTAEQATEAEKPHPEAKVPDTSYIVVKKTFTPGKLVFKGTSSNPNLTERQPADCRIVFKGVPSGKEYPELEMQEVAYGRFREGVAYSPQDINLSKKPVPGASGSNRAGMGSSSGGGTRISDAEARAIFGN